MNEKNLKEDGGELGGNKLGRKYILQKSVQDENELKLSNMLLNRNMQLPREFDLLHKVPKIRNQKGQGSCGAFSLCTLREMLLEDSSQVLSPAFLYYQTRKDNGSVEDDFGINIRAGLEALRNYGVCEEEFMPYNEKIYNEAPSEEAIENATRYKINTYINIDNGIIGIKNWLISKQSAIVFGMTAYDEFNHISKSGIVPIPHPKDITIGKHACCIVGWKDNTFMDNVKSKLNKRYSSQGYFICINSFSDKWGDNGLFYLPYEYVQKDAFDFYVITV